MRFERYGLVMLIGACALLANGAQAATTVTVALEDSTTSPAVKGMAIKPDRTSAPAGQVTFEVANKSKSKVHEMLVVKTSQPATALPYDARTEEVDEDKIKSLGEVSELRPGKSGSLTLDLKPGSYLLLCNQPGHMRHGMWARFQVTPRQG